MPRYEFKDAKSAKFWTIIQNGAEYTVCYGKIGTDGVEQTKEFDSDEACKKAYDKLVMAKVKKGYALADGVSEDGEEPSESSDGRPKSVPAGAIKAGHEWEFAEKNAKGENHGVVTWWRLDGTCCCRTEYLNGKPHGSFQRFHENGQVSREGTFAQGKMVGLDRFHRSSEKTSEHFAVYSAGKRVWTAENDLDKGVRRFFDKDGDLCDQQGKKIAVAPEVEDGLPRHWRAPQKSTEVQKWEPTTFGTELRDGVFFTDDLRRVIFPRHRGVKTTVRPVPSVKVAWAALRRAMWACDNAILEHAHSSDQSARSTIWSAVIAQDAKKRSYGARMLNHEHQAATFDEDLELSRGLFRRYNGVSVHHMYSVATYERAADYFVASRGLGDAAVLLMRGIDDELPYQRMGPFERIRDLLAVASEEDFAAAKKRIVEGYAEALAEANKKSYVGRLPAHLAWALSFLLPLGPGTDDDARIAADRALLACKGRGFGNDELNAGGLASVDIAGLNRFIETNPKTRHEFFAGGARIYLASILDTEGIKAAPILSKMKPSYPFEDSANENNRWAFLLAHLDSDDALGALHDEHKAGYAWGAEALALANQLQPARVEALLKQRKDAALLETLKTTTPLGPPPLTQADADADGVPSAYRPAEAKRAPERSPRIATDFESDWTDEEREVALGRGGSPLLWNDEPLSKKNMSEWVEHCERWAIPSAVASFSVGTREFDERLAALGYSFRSYDANYGLALSMLVAGEGAIGLLATMLAESLDGTVAWAMPFAHPTIAPPILSGFTGKKYKTECRAWILRHPRCAWACAVDMALTGGKKKLSKEEVAEKTAGERTLRYLASQGYREAILKDAKSIGEEDAIRELLDVDPLTQPKAKVPKLPSFASSAALPSLERIKGGKLSKAEVEALLVRLAVSNVDEVHPAVTEAQGSLTSKSKTEFAWALFEAWLKDGADSKQGWAMQALGFFGDDDTARSLCALAKDWPGQNASARAQAALDALLSIGTDAALVNMNLLAEKSKYPAFKAAAAERIGLIAQKRGMTRDELQDRLVPTLSLEDGGSKLDYGSRHFVVSFDEQLRPILHDDTGKKIKSLPKPGASDDAGMAKAAKARFSGLTKDAKASASVHLARLERAMKEQRSIDIAVFEDHFVAHPWMSHLTKRLVWCALDDQGKTTATFRVTDEGTFANATDEDINLKKSSGVSVAHPIALGGIESWSAVFADYEIIQPFEQLSRTTFLASKDEATTSAIQRFAGTKVPYGMLRALTKMGWQPWADSWINTYSKDLPGKASIQLNFSPGYSPAGDDYEDQVIESVELQGAKSFGEVDPIAFSELVRDLTMAAS